MVIEVWMFKAEKKCSMQALTTLPWWHICIVRYFVDGNTQMFYILVDKDVYFYENL